MAAERLFLKSAQASGSAPLSASEIRPLTHYHLRNPDKLRAVATPVVGVASPQLNLGLAPSLKVVQAREPAPAIRVPSHLSGIATGISQWSQGTGPRSLWLFGASGSGKSLLLNAVLAGESAECRVTNCDRFFSDWVEGFRTKRLTPIHEYKNRTRLLVLEGLDTLATRAKTQIELLRTIEAVHARGGAVAVSSRESPAVLAERFEASLLTKLSSGLMFEMPRVPAGALEEVVNEDLMCLSCDERAQLCARLSHVRWMSFSALRSFVVNLGVRLRGGMSLAKVELSELLKITNGGAFMAPKQITPEDILNKTSALFGVTAADIKGSRRTRHVGDARLFCYRALHELAGLTQSDIADLLGRDPSSVNKGIQQMRFRIEQSPFLQRRWKWVVEFVLQSNGGGDHDGSTRG